VIAQSSLPWLGGMFVMANAVLMREFVEIIHRGDRKGVLFIFVSAIIYTFR